MQVFQESEQLDGEPHGPNLVKTFSEFASLDILISSRID